MMSGLSIENFRALGNLGYDGIANSRRVRIEGEPGQQRIVAPERFGGAVVNWFQASGLADVNVEKAPQNTAVREAFYQALVKSYGKDIADDVIAKHFMLGAAGFQRSELALT